MPARPIRRPANVPAELRPTLDAIEQALADNRASLMEGKLTDEITFGGAGTQVVKHGLTRKLRGWFVVRLKAGSAVTLFEDITFDLAQLKDTHIAIGASGVCQARFWVW